MQNRSKLKKPCFIAIEGCIGVGKTTLTNIIASKLGTQTLFEVVEKNPFLAGFYQDKKGYAFQTQIFFLLSRFKQIENITNITNQEEIIVADYALAKDKIFAQNTLSSDEYNLYEQVYNNLHSKVRQPDVLIYLRAPHNIIMERIKKRGRSFEKNMDPEYIYKLIQAYDDYFAKKHPFLVITVDTEHLDFPKSTKDSDLVIDAMHCAYSSSKINNWQNANINLTGISQ